VQQIADSASLGRRSEEKNMTPRKLANCLATLLVCGSVVLLGLPTRAHAGTCGTALFSAYDMSGFSCTIDDKTFANFSLVSNATGTALAIPATGITVVPVISGNEEGFQFDAAWTAGSNSTSDSTIGFSVANSSGAATIEDASLVQSSGGFTGTGSATVSEGLSLTQPPCSKPFTNLFTVDTSGTTVLGDQTMFTPTGLVTACKDLTVAGGTSGTASLSVIEDTFSQVVPEPSTLILFGIGLVGFCFWMRRKPEIDMS
jgi:hypothetical protein